MDIWWMHTDKVQLFNGETGETVRPHPSFLIVFKLSTATQITLRFKKNKFLFFNAWVTHNKVTHFLFN
jgi:hypothetical protein